MWWNSKNKLLIMENNKTCIFLGTQPIPFSNPFDKSMSLEIHTFACIKEKCMFYENECLIKKFLLTWQIFLENLENENK